MLTETIEAQDVRTAERVSLPPANGRRLAEAMRLIGAPMRFDRDAEIYGQDEPADYLYQVISGAVRMHKLLSDGRRLIGAFHLPGDVFGLDAGPFHRFSADAIGATAVRVARRSTILAMAAREPQLATELWAVTALKLQHAEDHMLLLGRKTAEERVASFLLEMASRGAGGSVVELPMSRQDIADYLGLTIETVSRTLTLLEDKAAIALPSSRRITLCNRGALQRLDA